MTPFEEKIESVVDSILSDYAAGRDIDKIAETGITPVDMETAVGFEEATVNVVLKKLAYQDMKPDGFIDETIMNNYANNDFHRVYVGEIVKVVVK